MLHITQKCGAWGRVAFVAPGISLSLSMLTLKTAHKTPAPTTEASSFCPVDQSTTAETSSAWLGTD